MLSLKGRQHVYVYIYVNVVDCCWNPEVSVSFIIRVTSFESHGILTVLQIESIEGLIMQKAIPCRDVIM